MGYNIPVFFLACAYSVLQQMNAFWPPCAGVSSRLGLRRTTRAKCSTAPATAAARTSSRRSRIRCVQCVVIFVSCVCVCANGLVVSSLPCRIRYWRASAASSWLMVFTSGRSEKKTSSLSSSTSLRPRLQIQIQISLWVQLRPETSSAPSSSVLTALTGGCRPSAGKEGSHLYNGGPQTISGNRPVWCQTILSRTEPKFAFNVFYLPVSEKNDFLN